MGRLFLVQLDDSYPDQDLIGCRNCQTHLALAPDETKVYAVGGITGCILAKVVNVCEDKSTTRMLDQGTVQDVHCIKCGDLMGLKFVEVPGEESHIVQNGYVLLNSDKFFGVTPKLEMFEYDFTPKEEEATDDQEEQA